MGLWLGLTEKCKLFITSFLNSLTVAMLKIWEHDTYIVLVIKRNSNGVFREVNMNFSKETFTFKASYGLTLGRQMSFDIRS